jgi:hypothetical protein|nr:MAG TPA: hypothetical protein [Caudoviricetes sp.]
MYNENELIRAAIDRKIRESLAAQQQENNISNPLDRINNIGNKLDSASSIFSTAGDFLSNNTPLTKLGAGSQAVGKILQEGASSIAPSIASTAGSSAAGTAAGSTASGAAMAGPIGALVALGATAIEGTNRKRAKQAGEQSKQLAENAIETRNLNTPVLNPIQTTPQNNNQISTLEQNGRVDNNTLPTPMPELQVSQNPEEMRKSAFGNIANGLDDFLAGYKENKTQGFHLDNLKADDSKSIMQRLGEGAGTVARVSQNPVVQGIIAGGLSGLFSGDALYGLSSAYKYANSKYKANLFKDILAQQGLDVDNNNGIIDASDLAKILVSRRYQKDFMSRGEYDRFRLDNGELSIDEYNSLINNPDYNPDEILNIAGLGNMARANRYYHQNKTDKLNNFMSMDEYNKLRVDNGLITPEEYEKIINSPDYNPDEILNIAGLNAVSKAGKYMQDNKESRSKNYWRSQNKGQNVIRVEYGQRPDTHNYTHVTYGEKPENKSTTYIKYENKPQSHKPQTTVQSKPNKPVPGSKTSTSNTERVLVMDKNGNTGSIPKNYLLDALKEGYKLIRGK